MSIQILWTLALLALGCEYVDSTLGMGYGTTLTPVLLLIGYEPAQIVPSVLLSEFLTGVLAGFALALITYWLQITFGIVRIPGNFVVDAYPVSIRFIDFVVVAATVISIGMLASVPPALRARRVSSIIREE